MLFKNRTDAGQKLAIKLKEYLAKGMSLKHDDIVIIGLPRGGVTVALEVAKQLGCTLDILVSKKIPFPGQPEFGIGAVSSDDVIVLNPDIPHNLQWQQYLNQQHYELLHFARNMETKFYESARFAPSAVKNKVVIVVDDGIATGMTAAAALKSARLRGAKTVILAAPVISNDSINELDQYCDTIVPLHVPSRLEAVGHYYLDFTQTSDAEVIQAMRESRECIVTAQSENFHSQPEIKA